MARPKSKPAASGGGISQEQSGGNEKLIRAVILVFLVTLAGTLGFRAIENWPFWKAFYFTIVTITTVGYGDEGLSETGQKFATLLLIIGVSSASYTFAMIVQTSVASQFAWRKRMNKAIARLRNHTIVCGFGRLGESVCEHLHERKTPFVVIERDAERFAHAVNLGYLAIEDIASENDSIMAAGLEHASHVVAAVDSYAENVVIAMEARELNPEVTVIARAEREENVRKLERAGVSRVLCPFQSGGRETADYITQPRVANFLAQTTVGGGGVVLADILVEHGSKLAGMRLGEFGSSHGSKISFVALNRDDEPALIPPRGDTLLEVGDHLIVAGDPDQIAKMTDMSKGRALAA